MDGLHWKTATIAHNGTVSGAVDLDRPYKSLAVLVPTLDNATVAIHTAMTADGTYQALQTISNTDGANDAILCAASTGAFNLTVPFCGWQHLKFVAGAAQATAARTIYVAGFD